MADKIVNVDTDNLDDFEALFTGKATAAPADDPEPEDDPVDTETDPEEDTLANEPTDEADDDEDTDPDGDEEPEPEVKPKKKTVQERINELTAEKHEARRELEEMKRQLAELKAAKDKTEAPQEEPKAVVASGDPDPDELLEDGTPKYPLGEYDPKYIRDLMKIEIARENAAKAEREAQETAQAQVEAQRQALREDWSGRVNETIERLPDFAEKVTTLESTFTSLDEGYADYLATTIMSMENGTDVLYFLSNNLEEARRIASLGPVKATIALGRIEASFDKADEPESTPKPKVTQAPDPAPIRTKGAGGKHSVAVDTDDLEAFEKEFFRK